MNKKSKIISFTTEKEIPDNKEEMLDAEYLEEEDDFEEWEAEYALTEAEDWEGLIKYYQVKIDNSKSNYYVETCVQIARVYTEELKQYQKAIDYLNKSMKLANKLNDHKARVTGLVYLGDSRRRLSEYYKAIDAYKLLLKLDGPKPLYWQILANLYIINGNYDSAMTAIDSVLFLDTTQTIVKLLKAQCYGY